MQCHRRDLDPCIYLLIEHLDAALAAGEQLTSADDGRYRTVG